MPSEEIFFEIGIVLVIAAALAMLVHRLRQPLIIAYLVAGVIVGPGLFALTRSSQVFEAMSEIGVAFLLFTVGLGLNWRVIKGVGGAAFTIGVGQVLFTTAIGFLIGMWLGMNATTSLYIAAAFALSSTIVVVKLLADRDELDSLYGRISVGVLLVQDFIALVILLAISAFSGGAALPDVFVQSLVKGMILLPALWLVARFLAPAIASYAARSQELLFVFAIAWCFFVAGILSFFGFGVEFGALLAGIMLSGTVYEKEIQSRMRPLRDFFLIIFFIILGTHLDFESLARLWRPIITFSLFVVLGTPLVVMFLMRVLGYHARTGFRVGTALAQVSEFSFIIIVAGVAAGHLEPSALVLTTAVALLTIAASAYLIAHNQSLYNMLAPLLRWAQPAHVGKQEKHARKVKPQVVLLGAHRLGERVLEALLHRLHEPFLVVDFDPAVVRQLAARHIPVVYGDAGDDHFLSNLKLQKAKLVISTIPSASISLSVLAFLRAHRFAGSVVVCAHTEPQAKSCYDAGADYVIMPGYLGGEKFRELLEKQQVRSPAWKRLGERAKKVLK